MWFVRFHIFPLAGGLHDQPADFIDALEAYLSAKDEHARLEGSRKSHIGSAHG